MERSDDLVPLLACRACGLVDPSRDGADPVCNLVDRDGFACCPCGADPLHGFLVVWQRSPSVQLELAPP